MNLNEFVVLPNSKARSVKLNARNLQELQTATAVLAQESREMEEKLQQLKESMSQEKEERGHSGAFRWKSGQCGTFNSNTPINGTIKTKNRLQKLSAGKVKIRVLKDEPLTVPPHPVPPPPSPTLHPRMSRKNRLRGTYCGQCDATAAELVCAECSENYCAGCFTRVHQKGALKLHRILSIQGNLQTDVSTRDVVTCLQKQVNPRTLPGSLNPSPITREGDHSPKTGREALALQLHPDHSQVLPADCGEEKDVELIGEAPRREDASGFPATLLEGEFNEEESARSFQEALRRWRDGTPSKISVSATATQADLDPDSEAGRGGGKGRVPVRVEFTENSLTYMDRLLLKKHRRTPIERYHPLLAFDEDLHTLPDTNDEEETASVLTVPVSRGRTEPEITAAESCLTIEVLDETDGEDARRDFSAEQESEESRKDSSDQKVPGGERETASSGGSFSRLSRSSPSPTQASRRPGAPGPPWEAAQKLRVSQLQTFQAQHSVKSSSSKSTPSASPSAETPRTSKASIKTPTSKSQKPNCSPTVHKSKPDRVSPRLSSSPLLPSPQNGILKSSHAPVSFPNDVSPLASSRPPVPGGHLSPAPPASFSLKSTFTLSPSGSTDSLFLPKVYQSTSFQRGSDSSPSPEQPQISQLVPEPISSLKPSQPPSSNVGSLRQSQLSLYEPEYLLPVNQPPSPVSSGQNPPLNTTPLMKTLSVLSPFNEPSPDAFSRHRSTAANEDDPDLMPPLPVPDDHESTLALQEAQRVPSHQLTVMQNPLKAVKMEKEEEPSADSRDEMSVDSLGLAPLEGDSSDEEAQMHGCLTRGSSREEAPGNPAGGEKKHVQTDEQDQLSEPLMVRQRVGFGSEQLCDQDGFRPLGLDVNCGHSDTPKHALGDSPRTSQTPPYDSDPTGSGGYWPSSSSLDTITEEQLLFRMMMDNHTQRRGIQIHSTTTSWRGEISANELGTSGSNWSLVPAPYSASRPASGSQSGASMRPLSRAAQEIIEICSVDQSGCEDPDLDTDTTAHTLLQLEQELRLMTKETGKQASVFDALISGSRDELRNHHFTRSRISVEDEEAAAAARRDQESVLLLP